MSYKTDCYWYDEDQDMNAFIPECKARKIFPLNKCDCEKCNKYHSKWKKTNADRIRSMTDEELALWINKHDCHTNLYGYDPAEAILVWLKEEVKDGCS